MFPGRHNYKFRSPTRQFLYLSFLLPLKKLYQLNIHHYDGRSVCEGRACLMQRFLRTKGISVHCIHCNKVSPGRFQKAHNPESGIMSMFCPPKVHCFTFSHRMHIKLCICIVERKVVGLGISQTKGS